jgi:hypothetical protein
VVVVVVVIAMLTGGGVSALTQREVELRTMT